MQSRLPIVLEQSWNACLISRSGRQPSMSCLLPRINSGAVSNDVHPKTLSNALFDSINRSGSAESMMKMTPWQSLKYLSHSVWSSSWLSLTVACRGILC